MQESRFSFYYTWADLQPVRALAIVVFGAQIGGAVIGVLFAHQPTLLRSIWFGAAIATFPAFLAGLAIQSRWRAGSLAQNRVMVWRLGLVALVLTVAAIFMPPAGFDW